MISVMRDVSGVVVFINNINGIAVYAICCIFVTLVHDTSGST